jgi:FkbM family methyltransferase
MHAILEGRASSILDVGAHVGETALRFAEVFPNARIFSFEPDPKNFDRLIANTRNVPAIVPVKKAVAEQVGAAKLYRTRFDQAHSLLPPRNDAAEFLSVPDLLAPEETETVETVTIDDFCRARELSHVDVLKIDAQGAELAILQGAEDLLKRRAASLIHVEVNFIPFYEGSPLFPEIYEHLYERGYRLVALYDLGFSTHYYQVGCNALFVEEGRGRRVHRHQ